MDFHKFNKTDYTTAKLITQQIISCTAERECSCIEFIWFNCPQNVYDCIFSQYLHLYYWLDFLHVQESSQIVYWKNMESNVLILTLTFLLHTRNLFAYSMKVEDQVSVNSQSINFNNSRVYGIVSFVMIYIYGSNTSTEVGSPIIAAQTRQILSVFRIVPTSKFE